MGKIKVNKIEAARRQIDAGIRMVFSNEDPVAIHTLVGAALRILRDLASKRGDSYMHNFSEAMIKPERKREFWQQWYSSFNFLKHADKDPDAILANVDEGVNEGTLFIACLYYQDIGHQFTPEMLALLSWFLAIHPEFFREDIPAVYRETAIITGESLRNKTRTEQLATGEEILRLARSQQELKGLSEASYRLGR